MGIPTPHSLDHMAPARAQGSSSDKIGEWGPVFSLPNVAVHTHLLPNGKVLFWGRRDLPTGTLDDHFCTPQIWDPLRPELDPVATPQPKRADGSTVNLFCSGHSLLSDGKLLVTGGHFKDSLGIDQSCLYDFTANTWTPLPVMNNGRWYPSVVTLANGHVVVISGSFAMADGKTPQNNNIPQLWDGTTWHELSAFPAGANELFPCLHLAPDGRIFMSGPGGQAWFFDTSGAGTWTSLAAPGGVRANARRDYAPSVVYDVGKIIYIGGGNNPKPQPTNPTAAVEVIDLTVASPAWRVTNPMHFARRHHNATLLPDGTLLVTGGTQGLDFNDLTPGSPAHTAELWDPRSETWTVLASETVDRCYHATAILLPDATVLSAGGGEYDPLNNGIPNALADSHRDAQIYRPPYLFRGPRPNITMAPTEVRYGETFVVETSAPEDIGKVTWLRLASTTHTANMNQRMNVLAFEVAADGLRVTSPDRAEICPPGHYMLFVLDRIDVPSIACIIRISASRVSVRDVRLAADHPRASTLEEIDQAVRQASDGTKVTLGLTSQCPYGLGACWGGAYEALTKLDGVEAVRPIANAADSTADVFLHGDVLPNIDRWTDQIRQSANGSYHLRGIEVSITGSVERTGAGLVLTGPSFAPVTLRALGTTDKVQYDRSMAAARPSTPDEVEAFERLSSRFAKNPDDHPALRITGPFVRKDDRWLIHVRRFAEA